MLIIFDFDGVIFEAKWQNLFKAYRAIIKEEGKNSKDFFKNLEEFKRWWTPDWHKNNKKIGIQSLNKSLESHALFYKVYNSGLGLFSWVNSVMKTLYQNHRLAVLTNRHKADAEKYLNPVIKYFSLIVGCEDIKKLKPDPEGINFILWRSEIFKTRSALSNVLMIGDMPDDIMAGKAAGIKTGAVKWGLGDWNELLALNPDYAFEKYKDLLGI